jgi:hypothetical protein
MSGRTERAIDFFVSFIVVVIVIIILGAFYPEYFGFISQLLVQNLGTLTLFVFIMVIVYLLIRLIWEW